MEIFTLIVSIMGGGVIVGVMEWIRSVWSAKKEQKISFLDKQIRELYGPLNYFVCQTERLFELNTKIHNAYKIEYIDTKYGNDKITRKNLDEKVNITLDIANKYISYAENNNLKIEEILNKNYSLIDPDDIELFLTFFENHIRSSTERDKSGKLEIPLEIYKKIGDIYFLKPDFIKKVKEKFLDKKNEFDKLIY